MSKPASIPVPSPMDVTQAMLSMAKATSPSEVAATTARILRSRDLRQAAVLWSETWPRTIRSEPADVPAGLATALENGDLSGGDPAWYVQPLFLDTSAPSGTAPGAVVAWSTRGAAMSALDELLPLLEFAGDRLSQALENDRLNAAVQRLEGSERLQRALFAIADMAGSDHDMPTMLHGLHRIVAELMYAENFYIALYDPEQDALRFIYFADTEDADGPTPDHWVPLAQIERGLTWYVIRDGKALMGATSALREQVSGELNIHGPDSDDWLGVPMHRGPRVMGAIVVQSYVRGIRYTESDKAVLGFVADHILTALERKRGQEELEQQVQIRTRELAELNAGLRHEVQERERGEKLQAALYRLAAMAGNDESMSRFYAHVHGIVGELINARNFYIALLSDDGDWLEFPYYVDAREAGQAARAPSKGLTEYVIRTGRPLLAGLATVDGLVAAGEVSLTDAGNAAHCWLGVPLLTTDRVLGALVVQSYTPDVEYGPREAELLTFVSYQVANSLQRRRAADALVQANAELEDRVQKRTQALSEEIEVRKQIQEQLNHQVMHDALTGLPNRVYLRDRLERAIAQVQREPDRHFALLYLDVDRFKVINDNLGHPVGDVVLQEVARRLGKCVRNPDVVARLSGDEFAVLLENVPIPETACQVAQRILRAFAEPVHLPDRELDVSTSVGIAIGDSRYATPDEILRDSDTALYGAKASGRGCFHLFDEMMHRDAMNVLEVEGALRAGLANHEFEPHFQPIVRLDDGSIQGYEALLRWNHPQRGLLAPGEFLKIAEDAGLIDAIDWQIFEAACRRGAALVANGGFITVNVSPRHFRRDDLDVQLSALLARTGFPPGRLRIEVTEGTLLRNPTAAAATLQRLAAAGIHTAIDDFGTGYSSLNYINLFPVHTLKIDRSFMAGLAPGQQKRGAAIVRTILALAQALEIDVVAEGIETEEQRAALRELGCLHGQGFLFARPAPADHWLAKG
jgi:diguanylate cyclase (GGDEF)-like protein